MNGCSLAGGLREGTYEGQLTGLAWVQLDTKGKEVWACPCEEQAALGGASA